MRRWMRCDCAGEPPGELMTSATAADAGQSRRPAPGCSARPPIERPARNGDTAPIAPLRRRTATRGTSPAPAPGQERAQGTRQENWHAVATRARGKGAAARAGRDGRAGRSNAEVGRDEPFCQHPRCGLTPPNLGGGWASRTAHAAEREITTMRVMRWMVLALGMLTGAMGFGATASAAPLPVAGSRPERRRRWWRRRAGTDAGATGITAATGTIATMASPPPLAPSSPLAPPPWLGPPPSWLASSLSGPDLLLTWNAPQRRIGRCRRSTARPSLRAADLGRECAGLVLQDQRAGGAGRVRGFPSPR